MHSSLMYPCLSFAPFSKYNQATFSEKAGPGRSA
jgi:hypothetical protein